MKNEINVQQLQAANLFISYSHSDGPLRIELEKHLRLMERQGYIDTWCDRCITPGESWGNAIDEHLKSADLILLLISADFMASEYCYQEELHQAMLQYRQGISTVIPIIARAVDWKSATFGELQALPTDGKPITSWKNLDEAFENIAQGIRKVISSSNTSALSNTKSSIDRPLSITDSKTIQTVSSPSTIELTIDRNFDEYTEQDQAKLLKAIRHLLTLQDGDIKVVKKQRGSVKLELSISKKDVGELSSAIESAIESGELGEYDVVAVNPNNVHKLKAKDSTGRWAYYFILIPASNEKRFLDALKNDADIDLENYGTVIASCYGESPSDELRNELLKKYGWTV